MYKKISTHIQKKLKKKTKKFNIVIQLLHFSLCFELQMITINIYAKTNAFLALHSLKDNKDSF